VPTQMSADQEKEFASSTNIKTGLTSDMVEKRQLEWGYNELPSKTRHPLLVFLSYFWGPMPVMICGCFPPSARALLPLRYRRHPRRTRRSPPPPPPQPQPPQPPSTAPSSTSAAR
jgi:hypothetical protein